MSCELTVFPSFPRFHITGRREFQRSSSTIGSARSFTRGVSSTPTPPLDSVEPSPIPDECSVEPKTADHSVAALEDSCVISAKNELASTYDSLFESGNLVLKIEREMESWGDLDDDISKLRLFIDDTRNTTIGSNLDHRQEVSPVPAAADDGGVKRPTCSTPRATENINARISALFRRLVDSEALYLRDMQILVRAFVIPLWEAQLLDRKMTTEIVSTAEFILKVNQAMLEQLLAARSEIITKGAKIFLNWVPSSYRHGRANRVGLT